MSSIKKINIALVVCFGLLSCSPDEPFIDSFDDNYRFIVAGPSGVYEVFMPSGTTSSTLLWTSANDVEYPVQTIRRYRDEIFLLLQSPSIVVLDAATLLPTDTIALTGLNAAHDITFANATTAYASFPADNKVGVIDLTTNTLASTIDVAGMPMGLDVLGNQICVAQQSIREAAIIDTRTNTVTTSIPLQTTAPTFVAAADENTSFAIVCLGDGKTPGDTRTPSVPTLTFVNLAGWRTSVPINLTFREDQGPIQVPRGIALNASQFAFVPVQNSFLFISTRSQNRASSLQFDPYSRVVYNAARAEVVTVSDNGRTVFVFDENGETIKQQVALPDSVCSLVGVAP